MKLICAVLLALCSLAYGANVPFNVGNVGISFSDTDALLINNTSNKMTFKDSEVTSATLKDCAERIKYKNINLNGLNNNYVMTYISSTDSIDLKPAGGDNGVVPPFVFSRSGTVTTNAYLNIGSVSSNSTGQVIKGINKIVGINISTSGTVATTTRVQLVKRTAATTFTDISDGYIDLPSGEYKYSRTGMSVDLSQDEEVGAYLKSGSNLSNPVLTIYLIPR